MESKIEKTNFPFIKPVKDEGVNWSFSCFGRSGSQFIQLAVNNSYCTNFSCSVNNKELGREITADFFPIHDAIEYSKPELFDTFNSGRTAFFQKTANLAVFNGMEPKDLTPLFDTFFPIAFKSTKTNSSQWILVNCKYNHQEPLPQVPDELVKATAEYLGATMIVTVDLAKNYSWGVVEQKTAELFKKIAEETLPAIQYTDTTRAEIFLTVAKIRFEPLGEVKKLKLDKMAEWEDPMKNSILHIALMNPDINVFHYLMKKYPSLINKQNILGHTPLHILSMRRTRYMHEGEFDWPSLWKLPIKFSLKDNKGVTCLHAFEKEPDATTAFTKLIKNSEQWAEARKSHKRKRLLTNVLHAHIPSWTTEEKVIEAVEFFIKNGASIHHHEGKSLLNTAIKAKKAMVAEKLIALGSKLTVEDIMTGFETQHPESIRLLVQRPEMSQCSSEQLSVIVKIIVGVGLTDMLKFLVKRGCKADLGIMDHKSKLTTANLLAQMNRSTVMPLKYLCVDQISEMTAGEKGKKAKKMLETYPEEIQSLFKRKEVWRWALMMDAKDEERQRRILKLYQAILSAKRINPAETPYTFRLGKVEFSTLMQHTLWHIWPGTSFKPENAYELYYEEFSEYLGSGGHTDVWSKEHEKNSETLDQLMKECGWPVEDRYLFLHIIYTVSDKFDQQDSLTLSETLFTTLVNRFMKPPQWYSDFVLATFGIMCPPLPSLY